MLFDFYKQEFPEINSYVQIFCIIKILVFENFYKMEFLINFKMLIKNKNFSVYYNNLHTQ